jgi:ATF/CREB family transcription factor
MFPAPSPNSQALLQQLQSGGATPSTIEFHRTALAAKKNTSNGPTSGQTEQEQPPNTTMDVKGSQTANADSFTHHDAADAANGLFMLAKGGQQMNQPAMNEQTRGATRRVSHNANGNSGREMSGESDQMEPAKPAAKGKGRKNAAKGAANNRRKAEEPASKGPNKKAKVAESQSDDMSDEDDEDMKMDGPMDPKKMTDEEKRRNFLERNRYVHSPTLFLLLGADFLV